MDRYVATAVSVGAAGLTQRPAVYDRVTRTTTLHKTDTEAEARATRLNHSIVTSKVQRHRDLVGSTVTFTCSCGTKVSSKAGSNGAHSAFDKHIRRQEAK